MRKEYIGKCKMCTRVYFLDTLIMFFLFIYNKLVQNHDKEAVRLSLRHGYAETVDLFKNSYSLNVL